MTVATNATQSHREYALAYHPTSGETYAVRYDSANTIIEAAGPLDYHEEEAAKADSDVIRNWLINNADTAAEDAAWLEAELHGEQD